MIHYLVDVITMRRPSETLPVGRWPVNENCDRSVYRYCSEQVHLALGANGHMNVVFTTLDDNTPSEVYWRGSDGVSRTSSGSVQTYTQLLYVDLMLVDPAMGPATLSPSELLRRVNATGELKPGGKVNFGLGSYTNPSMYYDAPLIHTVSLGPLSGGEEYFYSVAGDGREFRFTMPPAAGAAYPYTISLTADLGQTAVSEASIAQMRRVLDDSGGDGVALIAGDLSYADGWGPRWDSYA